MREITMFLHTQKIQRPEPILSNAIMRLAGGVRSALSVLAHGLRRSARGRQSQAAAFSSVAPTLAGCVLSLSGTRIRT